jgi:hypothetical protein
MTTHVPFADLFRLVWTFHPPASPSAVLQIVFGEPCFDAAAADAAAIAEGGGINDIVSPKALDALIALLPALAAERVTANAQPGAPEKLDGTVAGSRMCLAVLRLLNRAIASSCFNQEACAATGIVERCLDVLCEWTTASIELRAALLALLVSLGSHHMSLQELKSICNILSAKSPAFKPALCVLCSSTKFILT